MSELTKDLASQNGNQASAMLGELTGDELLKQNGNQAGLALGELTGDELLAQNGNQAGAGVAEYFNELAGGSKCLTLTAGDFEKVHSVGFYYGGKNATDLGLSIQFSIDGGKTWEDYTIGLGEGNLVAIELDGGENVMFRGENESLSTVKTSLRCKIVGDFAASGDVTSLLNGAGGDVAVPGYCYNGMFTGCAGLKQAPALPATSLGISCYTNMFNGCTGLTNAPALPATTLADGCYAFMFSGCTAITSHDVATLNDSGSVFYNNSSCVSLTIHAEIPPAIGENTLTGLPADCIIYVPAASVDAYKAAQYWSGRADYIQAMP